MNASQYSCRLLAAALLLGSMLPAAAADQTATWNSTTGNWSDPTKWSTNPLFPNNGSGGFIFDAIMNGGTLFRDTAITLEKFTLAGGSMQGASSLTLNSTFTFTGGAIDSSAPVNANGGVTINTGNDKFMGGDAVLNLNSDTNWSAGRLRLYGATVNNAATQTLTMSFDGVLEHNASTNTFNNAGIFTKSGGTGTGTVSVITNNTGTINANSGTLSFTGGGTSTGAWNVATGATLNFGGGTRTLSSGSSVNGTGTGVVSFTAGTTNINAGSSYSVAGTTLISGGAIANFGTTANTNAMTLNGGWLVGTGTVNVSGPLTITDTHMDSAGTTNANGGTAFSGAPDKVFGTGRTLSLNSDTTWSAGSIRYFGATINNAAGSTFTTDFNGTMSNDTGTNAFNNAGIFTKSGGTGTTAIGVTSNNTGTVNANSGTLNFTGGGTSTGTWNAASGATLSFGGGTHALNAGTSFTGAGTILVAGATLMRNAAVTADAATTFHLSSGSIQGTGSLTLNGLMQFSGGAIDSAAPVNANGGVTMSTGNDKFMSSGAVLNLNSDTNWSAGQFRLYGATVNNAATKTLTMSFDGELQHNASTNTFNNAGIFTKSGGAGTSTVSVITNNTGTINANSGTLRFTGSGTSTGIWNAASGATLSFGSGTHSLNAGTSFTGAGTILVAGATLMRNTAVTADAATTFHLSSGLVSGTGSLTLNGLMQFSGGELTSSGPVNANGGVTISTGADKFMSGGSVLNLNSDTNWSAGRLRLYGATVNNAATQTLTMSFDGVLEHNASTNTFNNAGIFTKSGGTGTGTVSVITNNTGTINANSGTLSFTGGGTSTGAWNVASGATLNFGGDTRTLSSGSSVSGSGTGVVSFTVGTTNINAGSSYSVAGTTVISGGVAIFNTTATTNGLTLSGGDLSGTGTLTATGALNFMGRAMDGTGITNANGGTTFSTGNDKFIGTGRTLNLNSDSSWTGGALRFWGGTLNNTADNTFTTDFNGTISNDTGTNAFNNAGIFTKSGGTGTTTIGIAFNNTGMVNVNAGTLLFNSTNTSTHAGAFAVGTGAVLEFGAGSSSNLNGGTSFTGSGTTRISGGTVSVNAPVSMSTTLQLTGGTIVGSGALTVSGPMSFQGGDVGSGSIVANGGVTFSTGNDKFMGGGGDLHLGGTSIWTAGQIRLGNGAVLKTLVGGTLNNTFDGELRHDFGVSVSTFENAGTFTKSGGTGATNLGLIFNNTGTVNANSGTLALNGNVTQHSGSTLTGGTWNVSNGAAINIATGSNITTIGSGGSVMLDGAGSSFAKVTGTLNNNQGNFTLKNNRDLTTAGALTNSGTLRVEDSTTVMTIGSGGSAAYTQTIGETVLVGGAIIDASVFNLNGGELKGSGTIDSSVVTGGTNTIAPGLSPGALTIEGDLTLSAGSTLDMEIGGLTQGTLYDYLDVNGTLTLAGLLNLSFLNDFQNSLGMGSLFTLATSDAVVLGGFSNVANGGFLTDMASLHTFSVHYGAGSLYNPNDVVLYAVTPEPGRALLLMLGLLGLTLRRKRHACAVDSASV